uniref:Chloride channel protein n=1 Tax=Bursaphelenchus xylophilus TaxID=6326 RepID=A0A1I7S0E5_BURXY
MNDQLQRELKTLDRSYSYEQTVQLGRYRLDSEDEDKPDEVDEKQKKKGGKSVRFHEHDPREDWKEERKSKTCLGQLTKVCCQMRPGKTVNLFLSGLCNTMPIPCGMFMPTFVVGAAIGRGVGEFVSVMYPDGMPGGTDQPIFPGVYAVVGAAALSGAVSHSVSVAMICCEMTGQLVYLIPLMIAVIVGNAVCKHLQPSIYDAVINIKHLPYLPDIPPSNSAVHLFTAEHIMVTPVRYLTKKTTYMEIRNIVVEMRKVHSFPVVDDHDSMMLLGSIAKRRLLEILNLQIGDEARKQEAERRIKVAIETIDQHFKDNMALRFLQVLDADSKKTSFVDGDFHANGGIRELEHVDEINENGLEYETKEEKNDDNEDFANSRTQSFTRSRFTIEPVTAETIKDEMKKAKATSDRPKKIRYFSGGNGSKSPAAAPARVRRNAFSSASIHSENKEEAEEEERAEAARKEETKSVHSEVSDTSKKLSWPSKLNYDSVSKNLASFLRNTKNRFNLQKRKNTKEKAEYDLFEDERRVWEQEQLQQSIEIDENLIDPAPFQLVRRTSLYKVHSVFSLLSLNRAYVTDRGRLVGVVALKDVRIAIQNAQSGVPAGGPPETPSVTVTADTYDADAEKGLGEEGSQYGSNYNTMEPHPEVAQNFMEQIERHRMKLEQTNNSEVHDLLTPPLKIVHPSQADLQRYYNHPMLTIHEESEPINWSRKSSLKSQASTELEERGRVEFHTHSDANIGPSQPVSRRQSTILEELGEQTDLAGPVAEAVAYIQAKEVTIEDLRALGEEIEEEKHESQEEAEPSHQEK